MQTLTNPTKLTKKYYKTLIKERLGNRSFDRYQFQEEYNLTDRKVRRYINEIADEIGTIKTPELTILKQYCIENLTEKARDGFLNEKTEAKIALSGESATVDVNEHLTQTTKVLHLHMWRIGDEPATNIGSKISIPTIRETSSIPQ